MLVLKILGALLALGLGVWLGRPGRYEQSQEEIDRLLSLPLSQHRRVRRSFTPLDWLRKDARASERRHAMERRPFRTAAPKPSEEE